MNKTIQEYTEIELKSIAYDQLATIESAQNNLKVINAELARRNTPEPTETKESNGTKDKPKTKAV